MTLPANILVSVDLSGAEWHVTGYLANEPKMIRVHKEGGDPHAQTAHLMSGAPIALIKEEDNLLGHETDPGKIQSRRMEELKDLMNCGATWFPSMMTLRQAGKKSNHGLNYGMGYGRFALENFIPEADAKKMTYLYNEVAYPRLPAVFHASVWQELKGGEDCLECGTFRYAYMEPGVLLRQDKMNRPWERLEECHVCGSRKWTPRPPRILRNCFGRQIRLLGGDGPDLLNQAYSFKPQSSVADSVIQGGLCSFMEDPRLALLRAQSWTTTHDEMTIQYPLSPDLTDLAATLHELSHNYLRPIFHYPPHSFQLDVDLKMGFQFGNPTKDHPTAGLIKLIPEDNSIEGMKLGIQKGLDFLLEGSKFKELEVA